MRGLTPIERELLVEALTPSDPESGVEATLEEDSVFQHLSALGRVVVEVTTTDDWYLEDWRATELGRLALRVCPSEEA